jgi:hypothetical protein
MCSEDRVRQLVNAARDARRYLRNVVAGNGLNGLHDAVFLNRSLARVLELFEDVEPVHDEDRQAWRERQRPLAEAELVAVEVERRR